MNFLWHCQCYSWALWGVLHGIHLEKSGTDEQSSRKLGHWGRDDWQVSLSKALLPILEVRAIMLGHTGLDLLLSMQELVVRAWVEAAQHSKGTNANWWWWERGAVCAHRRKHQHQGLFQTEVGTYLFRAVGKGVIALRISIHQLMPSIICFIM